MKKIIAVIAALLICIGIFASCGNTPEKPGETEVSSNNSSDNTADENTPSPVSTGNLKDIITSLKATEADLGLEDKYETFDDVTGGKVDSALIGTWKTADGSATYTYGEDGILKTKTDFYGSVSEDEARYTCLSAEGKNIVCNETEYINYPEDGGKPKAETVIIYSTYKISGDVLYEMSVEEADPDSDNYNAAILIFYKADKNGSAETAIKSNPVNLESLYGTWKNDGDKSITIDENGLVCDGETYKLSINDENDLVAKKGGSKTAYKFSLVYSKLYDGDGEEKHVSEEGFKLALNYTGKDESDKPNLLPVMEDWHTLYEYDSWYYSANFDLAE